MGMSHMAMPVVAGILPSDPREPRGKPPGGARRSTLLPSQNQAERGGSVTSPRPGQEARLQRTPDQQAEQDALGRLVRQCIAGDQHAWQQLVQTQHRRVYAICYRFTGSGADAEDL